MSCVKVKKSENKTQKVKKHPEKVVEENIFFPLDESAKKTIQSIIKHKESVRKRLNWLAKELKQRAEVHDNSKLEFPEIFWLIQMDRETKHKYGTDKYFDKRKKWKIFFDNHYKSNSHHPEHYENGILDFTLADLCEFVVDVTAYCDRLTPEAVNTIVDAQAKRFGLDTQITQILKNTLLSYYTYLGNKVPAYEKEAVKEFLI